MVVMVEAVLDCGWFLGRDEIADARDTHDSTPGRHLADRFVGFAPRLIGVEGAAIGMSDEDRCLRDFESIERGAVAAMSDVNGHSHLIHPLDDGNAEIANAVIAPLRAPVTNQVAAVVGEQRDALPELIETIDVVWSPKMLGVLQPQNNADFAGALRGIDACCVVHAHEVLPVMRDKSIPQTEKPHHLVVRIWSGCSYSDVHDVDS